MKRLTVVFVLLMLGSNLFADRFLTRGHQPGEIYISSIWFQYADTATSALFFSDDYGQTLSMKYYYPWYSGGMPLGGSIVTDYTTDVIYNVAFYQLWRSYDSGYSWEICSDHVLDNEFSSGTKPGTIYKVFVNTPLSRWELHKSDDYGSSFALINDSVRGWPEVSTTVEGLYLYYMRGNPYEMVVQYSEDFGQSFSTICVLDSNISGYGIGSGFPSLSRGTTDGELYLTTLFPYHGFKIFYSSDRGQSWEMRFESANIDPHSETHSFTAGNEPGSFFYSKSIPLYHGEPNTLLCIYHSTDTAKTFREYCHLLDTGFPVNIYEEELIKHKTIEIGNYPNPFSQNTTITFELDRPGIHCIELTNLSGQAILRKEEYFELGKNSHILQTGNLSPGVYLCSIKANGQLLGVRKIVKR